MIDPVELLKLLGDSTRLRLLHLIHQEPLSVAELQEILNMGQSRISSHLAILRQASLVEDRKEGKKSYYTPLKISDKNLAKIFHAALESTRDNSEIEADRVDLDRILNRRREASEAYFNMVAGKLGKNYCPGRSWEAIGHFLLRMVPAIDIVDLGAGEGVISQLLAKNARSVYCIDNSPKMVEVGTELAKVNGFTNLFYKLGDIESVPLQDHSVDLALLSQALHHASNPEKAIAEAYRILRPGGQIIILDLVEHTFEKAHELYADQWLGFQPNRIYHWLKAIGFQDVSVDPVAKETEIPHFETLLASGKKPL